MPFSETSRPWPSKGRLDRRPPRAAWDKLVAHGPAVLPRLLEAMDTPDTVVANWLRTAFDRIVEAELKQGGKGIDADALLAFVRDSKRQGRARRLALERGRAAAARHQRER